MIQAIYEELSRSQGTGRRLPAQATTIPFSLRGLRGKKDDETQFTNYRPISLLPTISKIFEKIIFKHVHKFFLDNKLLYDSDYSFREGRSTEYAT